MNKGSRSWVSRGLYRLVQDGSAVCVGKGHTRKYKLAEGKKETLDVVYVNTNKPKKPSNQDLRDL